MFNDFDLFYNDFDWLYNDVVDWFYADLSLFVLLCNEFNGFMKICICFNDFDWHHDYDSFYADFDMFYNDVDGF